MEISKEQAVKIVSDLAGLELDIVSIDGQKIVKIRSGDVEILIKRLLKNFDVDWEGLANENRVKFGGNVDENKSRGFSENGTKRIKTGRDIAISHFITKNRRFRTMTVTPKEFSSCRYG